MFTLEQCVMQVEWSLGVSDAEALRLSDEQRFDFEPVTGYFPIDDNFTINGIAKELYDKTRLTARGNHDYHVGPYCMGPRLRPDGTELVTRGVGLWLRKSSTDYETPNDDTIA